MRAIVQRVSEAHVKVDGEILGAIDQGIMVLVGFNDTDNNKSLKYIMDKIVGLRIFQDDQEKMNLSVEHVNGGILIIPNFTLYGDCKKGKRPSFIAAAKPEHARDLFHSFVNMVKERYNDVEEGRFQADMKVHLINDGPVTVIIDSDKIV